MQSRMLFLFDPNAEGGSDRLIHSCTDGLVEDTQVVPGVMSDLVRMNQCFSQTPCA
jgi:hypothetical protein